MTTTGGEPVSLAGPEADDLTTVDRNWRGTAVTDDAPPDRKPVEIPRSGSSRDARKAAALRDNLRRRKDQARGRAVPAADQDAPVGSDDTRMKD